MSDIPARQAQFPVWATDVSAAVAQPPSPYAVIGFAFDEPPPVDYWNWLQKQNALWAQFLDSNEGYLRRGMLASGGTTATATTTPGSFTFTVHPLANGNPATFVNSVGQRGQIAASISATFAPTTNSGNGLRIDAIGWDASVLLPGNTDLVYYPDIVGTPVSGAVFAATILVAPGADYTIERIVNDAGSYNDAFGKLLETPLASVVDGVFVCGDYAAKLPHKLQAVLNAMNQAGGGTVYLWGHKFDENLTWDIAVPSNVTLDCRAAGMLWPSRILQPYSMFRMAGWDGGGGSLSAAGVLTDSNADFDFSLGGIGSQVVYTPDAGGSTTYKIIALGSSANVCTLGDVYGNPVTPSATTGRYELHVVRAKILNIQATIDQHATHETAQWCDPNEVYLHAVKIQHTIDCELSGELTNDVSDTSASATTPKTEAVKIKGDNDGLKLNGLRLLGTGPLLHTYTYLTNTPVAGGNNVNWSVNRLLVAVAIAAGVVCPNSAAFRVESSAADANFRIGQTNAGYDDIDNLTHSGDTLWPTGAGWGGAAETLQHKADGSHRVDGATIGVTTDGKRELQIVGLPTGAALANIGANGVTRPYLAPKNCGSMRSSVVVAIPSDSPTGVGFDTNILSITDSDGLWYSPHLGLTNQGSHTINVRVHFALRFDPSVPFATDSTVMVDLTVSNGSITTPYLLGEIDVAASQKGATIDCQTVVQIPPGYIAVPLVTQSDTGPHSTIADDLCNFDWQEI